MNLLFVLYKLCREARSDGLSEHDASHGFWRGASMTLAKNASFLRGEKYPKKLCLANACLNPPLMLYYGGSSLNGDLSPVGIETVRIRS